MTARRPLPPPQRRVKLRPIPLTLDQANALVAQLHRHHDPAQGHRFSVGALNEAGQLVGAVIVGRPVARKTEQYEIAEITRLVTDGTFNACSFLYGRAARICREMGFGSIQTFILDEEHGVTLRAAGWQMIDYSTGFFGWQNRPGRSTTQPTTMKQKWRLVLRTDTTS